MSQQSAASAAAAGLHPAAARTLSARRTLARQPTPRRGPSWDEYHRTVTGAAGPSLAAELQRQLAAQRQGLPSPSTTAAAAAQAGPLTALPQRDLLGRRIDRPAKQTVGSGVSSGSATSGELPPIVPLPARASSLHYHTPLTAAAAVLPAATPLSAHLQMRRARTLERRGRGSGSSDAPAVASPPPAADTSAADARARLTRKSLSADA